MDLYDVKAFGAIGDGVTDDTAVIQAAIDTLEPNEGLYFPAGNFLISGLKIHNDMALVGKGGQITLLPGSETAAFFSDSDVNNFKLENIKINSQQRLNNAMTKERKQ